MQLDVEELVGAAHGERGESRENRRNAYSDRDWHTLPRALPAQRSGVRQQESAADGLRAERHDLRAGDHGRRAWPMAHRDRSATTSYTTYGTQPMAA